MRYACALAACWPLLLAAPAAASPASAAEALPPVVDLAASIGIVTDYRFRGISLSDTHPSFRGSMVATHRSGAYAGISAYTLDGFGELGGSNLELDLSAGYRRSIGPVTADAGLLYYAYPGSSGGSFEFFEPYASVSAPIGPVTARLSAAYAPPQDGLNGNGNLYLAGELALPIRSTPVTLRARLGRSRGDTPLTPGGQYHEWLVGADYGLGQVTLGAAITGTDIAAADACAAGARPRDTQPTVSLTAALGF